ncbi:gp51 [Lomovskayavirus C31]|uniref:Gp51 n=1 Tax=Streptomyces phage phiC31 TaxID=10719 RepID=Q9ZX98_BPPHC|nr:gp51 [Lomovskayavirus C31]CAA07121.1 gp51 [Lomovskayavirus C31]
MGDHSKPGGNYARAALSWAKAHPKVVTSVVVALVGVATAVKPDFPGNAVLSLVHAILGA